MIALRRSMAAIALLGLASASAFAQYTGPGATRPARTVAEILKNPVDDQQVQLSGQLLRQTARERFTFSDGTGEITVEIDEEDFPAGQPVSAGTRVHITGEVEKRWMREPRIDVERLRLEAPASAPAPASTPGS